MINFYILITIFIAFLHADVIAGTTDSTKSQQITANNAIYGEIAGFVFNHSISLNFEHSIIEHVWLRVGYGSGIVMRLDGGYVSWGRGPTLMGVLLLGENHKFECGIGSSLVYGKIHESIGVAEWSLFPAASLGYRYQPTDGGFLFRIGLTYITGYGTPIEIGVGYAF